jgi:hypothetical protein
MKTANGPSGRASSFLRPVSPSRRAANHHANRNRLAVAREGGGGMLPAAL